MSLHFFSVEEKLAAITIELNSARRLDRPPGSAAQRHYELLKAIAADLQSRVGLPRPCTLALMEQALERMRNAPRREGGFYNETRMIAVADLVINKWPLIRQALERFGEEQL